MTMQIGMVGTDGVVLASDTNWMNNEQQTVRHTSNSSKIKIDFGLGVAISCARNLELAWRVADDLLSELSQDDWVVPSVRAKPIADRTLASSSEDRKDFQCLILSTKPEPQLFSLHSGVYKLQHGSFCQSQSRKAFAGDMANTALFWAERYYRYDQPLQPVRSLIPLAAHLIVTASKLNTGGISGLEIVFCDGSGLHRLSQHSTLELERQAEDWDRSVGAMIFGYSQKLTYAPHEAG